MQNFTRTFHATADLSSKQYHAVRLSDEYAVSAISDANAPQIPIGILQNDPDADGQPAEVVTMGFCRAECGGTISANDMLGMNNDGELISAAYEAAIGTADLHVFAIALEDGADGEIIEVFVFAPGVPGSTE